MVGVCVWVCCGRPDIPHCFGCMPRVPVLLSLEVHSGHPWPIDAEAYPSVDHPRGRVSDDCVDEGSISRWEPRNPVECQGGRDSGSKKKTK